MFSHGGSDYAYDGTGRLISQTVSSMVTEYLLDVQPGLYKVISATTGVNTDRYLHGPTGIHAYEDNAGPWQYMLPDALGSVRAEINTGSSVQAMRHFAPYGDVFGEQNTFDAPFAFAGEPYDPSAVCRFPLDEDYRFESNMNDNQFAYWERLTGLGRRND